MTDIINPKQAGILICISIIGSKILLLPSLMASKVKNEMLIMVMILFLIEFVIIYFLIKLKDKFYPLGFNEILNLTLGKVITKIIYIMLLIFLYLKFMYILLEGYNYLKEMVNEDAVIILYLACILPVVNSLVFMGLKSLGRTAQFYFWFIIAGVVFCLAIGLFVGNFKMPKINFGLDVLPKSFNFVFWFADFVFLMMFFDKVTPQKNYGKIILRYVLLAMILIFFLFCLYLALFHYTTFMHFFALSDIIQFSVFLGGLWKLDIIALVTMMILLFFYLGIIMYSMCECINKIFVPIKKYASIIITDFFIFAFIYVAGFNLQDIIKITQSPFNILFIVCLYILPVFFFIVYLTKKKQIGGKYEKIYK